MNEQASDSEVEELSDLNWNSSRDKSKRKAFNRFQNLAKGVIKAINEDAEWLELVQHSQMNKLRSHIADTLFFLLVVFRRLLRNLSLLS